MSGDPIKDLLVENLKEIRELRQKMELISEKLDVILKVIELKPELTQNGALSSSSNFSVPVNFFSNVNIPKPTYAHQFGYMEDDPPQASDFWVKKQTNNPSFPTFTPRMSEQPRNFKPETFPLMYTPTNFLDYTNLNNHKLSATKTDDFQIDQPILRTNFNF